MSHSESLRVVLVETHYAGNIGATARAMKTMGLRELVLVAPRCEMSAEARMMAASAQDVLAGARWVERLEQALAGVDLAVALSHRSRSARWPVWDVEETADAVLGQLAAGARVALVFGPEPSGLRSEHLYQCQAQCRIPSHPDCSSLNLAQAVQVLAYALYRRQAGPVRGSTPPQRAERKALEAFFHLLDELLQESDFAQAPKEKVLARLKAIYLKAELTPKELGLLHGFMASLGASLGTSLREKTDQKGQR